MKDEDKQAVEAAVFRRLIAHFQHRTDVQNIDLMGLSGFCRNCLSDWYREEAAARGCDLDKEAVREMVYGMPYADFKARHQGPASEDQRMRMAESVKKNEGRGF